jgi:hypothetical protein
MADLRGHLRKVETAAPPDLWAGIEARAREERPQMDRSIASVVAFRGPRAEQRRRLAAGLVAAAVVALTIAVAWSEFRSAPVVPVPPGTDTLPDGWVRCTNDVLGYSIGFPGDWHTTDVFDGTQDPANACQWFSPEAFGPQGNVVAEGWGYPLELAIRGSFDEVRGEETDPGEVDVLFEEGLVIEGHRAVRLEIERLVDVVADTGLHYEYLIELDPETTLIVHTTATRGVTGVYAENKVVLDYAVDTLRFLAVPSSPTAS